MTAIALSLLVLSITAVIGLLIGGIRIRGVSLGIGGVLFGGLIVGHVVNQFNLSLDYQALHFLKEFGLILFVYTIGIQVGPGFFASLRKSGLQLNTLAFFTLVMSAITTYILYRLFDIPLTVLLGIFSGAVTNTPSLAAGQQVLTELGIAQDETAIMGVSYAMAYPFGILGIIIAMFGLKALFRIDVDKQARLYSALMGQSNMNSVCAVDVLIENHNLEGISVEDFDALLGEDIVCSRIKSHDDMIIPTPNQTLHNGDIVHLVGPNQRRLNQAVLIVGKQVTASLATQTEQIKSQRVVVTNENVLGKTLQQLNLKYDHHVVVSRVNRAGVELIPNQNTHLQFGDILNIVGTQERIENAISILGNTASKLHQVQMLPIFIGIGLGVLLGNIPFHLPHLPVALKLGLAGGPLIIALILSRIGSIGRLYWFMPPSANLALREIGIVLFLAVVGINSGGAFLSTLLDGDGVQWMLWGAAITLVPLLTVGFIALKVLKLNFLTVCGLMAGSMTDPPALAVATRMSESTQAASLAYATVYPLVMCLRIVSPQLLAILLWVSM